MTQHIRPTWDMAQIANLEMPLAISPHRGFIVEDGVDADIYEPFVGLRIHQGLPDCFDLGVLEAEFDWIKDKSYAVHRMDPNMILPLHIDRYGYFTTKHSISDISKIVRVIVFLEDQKLGHVLQVSGITVPNWQAGDYVYWRGNDPHIAANLGTHDRYTLQITGIINE